MSYSRWSNSRWYTFWSSMGAEQTQYKWPTQRLKDNQIFEICDMPSYFITYGELKSRSRSAILHEIEEHFAADFEHRGVNYNEESGEFERGEVKVVKGKRPTWDELNELQDYFSRFIEDVDNHFKFWTFMRYEWYYPFRNKFIFKYRKLKERYVKDRSK